jgi:hypothetical protein
MAESYLTSLVTPTLAMYGAAPKKKKALPKEKSSLDFFSMKRSDSPLERTLTGLNATSPPSEAPASAAPAAPAAAGPAPDTRGVGMALAGFALATGIASGVSALVGHLMYRDVGAAKFAKVGAISYVVPAGLLYATTAFYVAQKKKNDAKIRQGSAS